MAGPWRDNEMRVMGNSIGVARLTMLVLLFCRPLVLLLQSQPGADPQSTLSW